MLTNWKSKPSFNKLKDYLGNEFIHPQRFSCAVRISWPTGIEDVTHWISEKSAREWLRFFSRSKSVSRARIAIEFPDGREEIIKTPVAFVGQTMRIVSSASGSVRGTPERDI